MSSGFVPAGSDKTQVPKDDAWLKAYQAIEGSRVQNQAEGKQEGGKSLYEVLQQNKTAKQEAFEETIRLKNQFRTLDDDEVDFLDSVLESTRAKEQQVKRETAEQLDAFRKQREAAEITRFEGNADTGASNTDATSPAAEESWTTSSRKRRRVKGKNEDGVAKLRRTSSTTADALQTKQLTGPNVPIAASSGREYAQAISSHANGGCTGTTNSKANVVSSPKTSIPSPQISPPALGLGAYSSDED